MNLEKLQISLEPKGKWEAMDLGIEVVKSNLRTSMSISFLITMALFLLFAAITQDFYWVSILIFMFKPIIERPLLYYFSRAIFDDKPSVTDVLKQLKSILWNQPLRSYTYRRFSPNRSFNDCVVALEGLKNPQRNARLKVLHHQEVGSTWLTFVMIHIELLLQLAFYSGVLIFLPESLADALFDDFTENNETSFYAFITCLIYATTVAVMTPFYVGCGFLLYLNRRTQLESWHIEVGFKKIQQRLSGLSTVAILLAIFAFAPMDNTAWADATEDVAAPAETVESDEETDEDIPAEKHTDYPLLTDKQSTQQRQALVELLNSDLFGEHYQEKHYELDWSLDWEWDWGDWFDDDKNESSEPPDLAWLEGLKDALVFLKWFIILVFAALLIWVLYKYKVWQWLGLVKLPERPVVEEVLGFKVTKESLPSALHATVMNHINENDFRQALSLMFRAYVSQGVLQYNIPFKASHTELECADLIKVHRPKEEANMFSSMMSLWLTLAYAHKTLSKENVVTVYQAWVEYVEDTE